MAAPAIAGLAAGIAFVMVFSLYSVPGDSWTPLNKNERIVMEIGNLKDTYRVNEPISFSIYVKGASANLCNDPKATVVIVSPENRRPA